MYSPGVYGISGKIISKERKKERKERKKERKKERTFTFSNLYIHFLDNVPRIVLKFWRLNSLGVFVEKKSCKTFSITILLC